MAKNLPKSGDPRVHVYKYTVFYDDTTAEKTVGHNAYNKMLGRAREDMGLKCMPGFVEALNAGLFSLITRRIYVHVTGGKAKFGDKITIRIWVSGFTSASFTLKAVLEIGDREVAVGWHEIVYADAEGNPRPLSSNFVQVLTSLVIEKTEIE